MSSPDLPRFGELYPAGLLDVADATKLVRDIIEAFFDKAVLGFYKVYGMMRDYHCILNHTPDLRILVVFACSRGSRLSILAGSFRHILYATEAPNGLLRVPDDVSHFEGVTATQEEMEHGGM